MKSGRDNWAEAVKNAASGYGATILGVLCFLISLTVIIALVRLVVGMGTGV